MFTFTFIHSININLRLPILSHFPICCETVLLFPLLQIRNWESKNITKLLIPEHRLESKCGSWFFYPVQWSLPFSWVFSPFVFNVIIDMVGWSLPNCYFSIYPIGSSFLGLLFIHIFKKMIVLGISLHIFPLS